MMPSSLTKKAGKRGKMTKKISVYDTTLRDGSQGEDISFTLEDKLRIALKLDALGVDFVEGGWPGSNPKDMQFFKEIKSYKLNNAKVSAFGSTARPGIKPEKDDNIQTILKAETGWVTIVGKTWDFHVKEALRTTLDENLKIIESSVKYLVKSGRQLIYDAEHFFDGYKANPKYAFKTIEAAIDGGAYLICLCDTNGGNLPLEVAGIIEEFKKKFKIEFGIHAHNDSELAVANSVTAVEHGATQVQGTFNGFGERCGNANLCSIIPNIQLKLGKKLLSDDNLKKLRSVSRYIYELANLTPAKNQPFVGDSAFAHKGGIHVSAINRNPGTYEHIAPETVGNNRRVLVSDLSGKSNILLKAREFNINLDSKDPVTIDILERLKNLESQGYQFEGAEASFELLMRQALGERRKYFELMGFRVIDEKRKEGEMPIAEATVMIKVGGHVEHTAAVGNGPVNALDNALRKALERFYPELKDVQLFDYKVRVLSSDKGTAAGVRVLIESGDKHEKWGTVGVSQNIIEASYQALVDSIEYKLYKEHKKNK
jgi:2-isopropylmalate synthase